MDRLDASCIWTATVTFDRIDHADDDVFPYWLLFFVWAAGAIQFNRRGAEGVSRTLFATAAVLTALMIGLRFEVGGDWSAYQTMLEQAYFLGYWDTIRTTDPAYATLNWIFAGPAMAIWPVNLICGILFMAGVGRFATRQPNPWLAILIAVPYFIIVVAMGYTRQAAAIGIVCFAIADAEEHRPLRIIVLITIAALFHKTAILMLPLLILPAVARNYFLGLISLIAAAALSSLALGNDADHLVTNYVQGNYDSQGAALRIAMNVVAGLIFLAFRKRMTLDNYERKLWTYASILSLASVVGLVTFSASSGVDRLSLFLIPLQLFTFSRLPYALSPNGRPQTSIVLFILGYTFAVQFTWLNYATNSFFWLPYETVFMR